MKILPEKKKYNNIFAPNIDREAVLTSTHNLCFGPKIWKIVYPCISQFYYLKEKFKGVFIARTCFPDVNLKQKIKNNSRCRGHLTSYI